MEGQTHHEHNEQVMSVPEYLKIGASEGGREGGREEGEEKER